LDEMSRDYQQPFYGSYENIRVSYLAYKDAWRLITNPTDDFALNYEPEAVERIITETGGQTYLVQQICRDALDHLNHELFDLEAEREVCIMLTDVDAVLNDDFFAAVGYGKVTPHAFVTALAPESELRTKPDGVVTRVVKRALGLGEKHVEVSGIDDVMITLARCCKPVRGEEIVGYITRGKGVSVHSAQCPNVARLMYDSERRIEVEWDSSGKDDVYDVKLALDVEDRQGLLAKIVSTIADEKTNIKNVDAKTFEGKHARVTVVLSVADRKQMERVMTRIRRISGVREVARLLR